MTKLMKLNNTIKDFVKRLTSRKFLTVVFGLLVLVGEMAGFITLTDDQRTYLIQLIVAYVGVEGIIDSITKFREV